MISYSLRFPIAAFALLALALAVTAGPATADSIRLTPEQKATMRKVDAYLNDLKSVKGRFTQLGPNGEFTEGAFYLARPGRIRFEYADPNPIRVVADGFWVGIENSRMKTVEKYPLSATPLRLLLGEDVNLLQDADIVDFQSKDDTVQVTLEDPRGTAPGQLTLIMGGPNFVLKEWVVVDAQGLRTKVTLFDLVTDARLSKRLFFIDDSHLYERGQKY